MRRLVDCICKTDTLLEPFALIHFTRTLLFRQTTSLIIYDSYFLRVPREIMLLVRLIYIEDSYGKLKLLYTSLKYWPDADFSFEDMHVIRNKVNNKKVQRNHLIIILIILFKTFKIMIIVNFGKLFVILSKITTLLFLLYVEHFHTLIIKVITTVRTNGFCFYLKTVNGEETQLPPLLSLRITLFHKLNVMNLELKMLSSTQL